MDAQELRNLQEAYMEVVENQQLDEAKEYDIYDIILSHLLDEGYAETPEAAEAIMVNMSEEWREGIVEEFVELEEAFKPMDEPKMQSQMKKHLARNNAKRERGERTDDRFGNMKKALDVIGKQQKSKTFKEKKTEKGKKTVAKQNADNFLLRDKWNASQQVRGRKPTVPNRHISRDEEGHKKHIERLKKSDVD